MTVQDLFLNTCMVRVGLRLVYVDFCSLYWWPVVGL